MRPFAMTGMETASITSSVIDGLAIRATPPAARISDGTLSNAITAAGAVAVMALERVPSDIRAAGGVARMANPSITEEVMDAVSIPVMAKGRIGHIVEARVLEAMGVDYIDESEVLSPADDVFHIKKSDFNVPFRSEERRV